MYRKRERERENCCHRFIQSGHGSRSRTHRVCLYFANKIILALALNDNDGDEDDDGASHRSDASSPHFSRTRNFRVVIFIAQSEKRLSFLGSNRHLVFSVARLRRRRVVVPLPWKSELISDCEPHQRELPLRKTMVIVPHYFVAGWIFSHCFRYV